jgi:hypothetical protein
MLEEQQRYRKCANVLCFNLAKDDAGANTAGSIFHGEHQNVENQESLLQVAVYMKVFLHASMHIGHMHESKEA